MPLAAPYLAVKKIVANGHMVIAVACLVTALAHFLIGKLWTQLSGEFAFLSSTSFACVGFGLVWFGLRFDHPHGHSLHKGILPKKRCIHDASRKKLNVELKMRSQSVTVNHESRFQIGSLV